ncbi:MAG: pyrroline-5-carboxylate reductase [Candidatus Nanopelagicales bacterium]
MTEGLGDFDVTSVALIGGGKMGEALLAGLVDAGHAVVVCEADELRAASLRKKYSVPTGDARNAAANADVVIIAVKPAMVRDVVSTIAEVLPPSTLVISVAAGITTATIEGGLPVGAAVVRAMPNTPALVGQGMTVVSAGSSCSADQLQQAHELLASVGEVAAVPESDQDAVTALSGSGPAYLFFVVEAMIDAGVQLGLDPAIARDLAVQTVYGAASMLRETGEDPEDLRANVTSPGGTTAAAIAELEAGAVRASFAAALAAARARSAELSAE